MNLSTFFRLGFSTISVVILFVSATIFAQTNITVINPSFEKPDSGKIKGWDGVCSNPAWTGNKTNIPGWNSDKAAWDSGIEASGPTDGRYIAFLMGGDTSVYQILSKMIYVNDVITLTVDARNSWQATTLKMQLFYMDTTARVNIVSENKTITGTMAPYSITFSANTFPAAIGKKLGILFDNVSDSASWLNCDNVRLTNSNPRIIDVNNYSFEKPDSAKIKGWDGQCSDPGWTGLKVDVPGWQSDSAAFDSGLELGGTATDGIWWGFLMGLDRKAPLYQVTNYVLQTGDKIELHVDARNSWQATTLKMELFQVDASGTKTTIATGDKTLTNNMVDYSITFDVSTNTAAIGKRLGIRFSNSTPLDQSWENIDNIRLLNNADRLVPVELTTFTASAGDQKVTLIWSTATESNNNGFEVERKIEKGTWQVVGFKKGNGTTSEKTTYIFVDDIKNISSKVVYYRLKQVDYNGTFSYSSVAVVNTIPVKFGVEQNFPNPFNPSTKIVYHLNTDGFAKLAIYNSIGQEVKVLVNEFQSAASYEVNLDASDFSSGIYYYILTSGDLKAAKKMLFLK